MATEITPFQSITYLGPRYEPKKSREMLPLIANETPSCIPSLFFKTPPKKHLTKTEKKEEAAQEKKNCKRAVHELFHQVFPTLTFGSEKQCVQQLKEDIQNHVYLRFQLLHAQFLMTYWTKEEFSYVGALAQAGIKNPKNVPLDLDEAHDAVLPCLLIVKDDKKRVFAGGSFFDHVQNMTMKLPHSVNAIDSWMEDTKKAFDGENLRDVAIELINKNAQGKTNPYKALCSFIEQFSLRIEKYETLAEEATPGKVAALFYKKTATLCLERLKKDMVEEKALCFACKVQGPLNKTFFLSVQKGLHLQLKKEMPIQEKLHEFFRFLPSNDTQNSYAKVCLSSRETLSLLQKYFDDTSEKVLKKDWKVVAKATPKKMQMLSKPLQEIASASLKCIKNYSQSFDENKNKKTEGKVQHLGWIARTMLFTESLTSSPKTTALYNLPETPEELPKRTRKAKEATEKAEDDSPLTGTPSKYANLCLKSNKIKKLLKNYFQETEEDIVEKDLANVSCITHSNMGSISSALKNIAGSCVAACSARFYKIPYKLGIIMHHVLEESRP